MLLAGRSGFAEQRRERNFDLMLASLPQLHSPEIVIVDIDQRSLAAKGQWPWGRDKIASLIGAVADAKPRSIGIDTLIAGPDERSPAALARRLAEITGKDDIARLVGALPDGDQQLAAAFRKVPTTLGVALNPERVEDRAPAAPVLVRGRLRVDDFWHAEGIIAPVAALTDAAAGLGMLLLPGDADGKVRRVPLMAVVGDKLWPSLAVEIVRNYGGASALLLSADTGRLEIAGRTVPIGGNGCCDCCLCAMISGPIARSPRSMSWKRRRRGSAWPAASFSSAARPRSWEGCERRLPALSWRRSCCTRQRSSKSSPARRRSGTH
jgi:adenylate cyclase